MSPLVTIAIPTYNASRWIDSALASALAQTYPDFEVLVVDNASTDDTAERVRRRGNERVRLEVQPENLGQYLPALRGPTIENWIGEPTSVMVRRSVLEEVGCFRERLAPAFELELWLRIMTAFDVGFVDEPLSIYRHHSAALTASVSSVWSDWLDLLWLHEALLDTRRLAPDQEREIRQFRRRQLLRAFKRQVGRLVRGNWDLRPLAAYLGYRMRGR